MIILIDLVRNKAVGQFKTITEAVRYANEEGIKQVAFEKEC